MAFGRAGRSLGAALVLASLAGGVRAQTGFGAPPAGLRPAAITLDQVLARSDAATGADLPGPTVEDWKISASGLVGSEHVVSDGDDYRETTNLGPFTYGHGRRHGQSWRQTINGFTLMLRDAHREDDVTTETLRQAMRARRSVRLLGQTSGPALSYVVEYVAAQGTKEWLFFDAATGLMTRLEMALADRRVTITSDDFRNSNGIVRAWHIHAWDSLAADNDADWRLVSFEPGGAAAESALEIPRNYRVLVRFPAGVSRVALPARFVGPHIIVRVQVGGRDFDFLLDTGTSDIAIDRSVVRGLGMHEFGHSTGTAAGAFAESQVYVPRMHVGALRLDQFGAYSIPFNYRPRRDLHVVGLLGFDLFAGAVIHIDYYHQRVEALSPGTFHPGRLAGASRIPIALDDAVPVAFTTIGGSAARLIVDTGAPSLVLFSSFARRHPEAFTRDGVSAALQSRLPYITASGVGGALRFIPVQLRSFGFGPESFHEFVVERSDDVTPLENADADGLLGWQFLQYFDIYLDYAHASMYVTPNAWLNDLGRPADAAR